MKKLTIRIIGLLLAVLLLVGCAEVNRITAMLADLEYTSFEEMVYTRPDIYKLRAAMDQACQLAEKKNFSALMDAIYEFNDIYDAFYTNYSLADIHYCMDLTDSYWEEEYNYCLENSSNVEAILEEFYHTLAKSPSRKLLEANNYFGPGFFDAYDGENQWDEVFLDLMQQESALQSRYYQLSSDATAYEIGSNAYYDAYATQMTQVLVDLIRLRQQIAAHWGYDDYVQFATDFYYYRDYTPAESEAYLADIRRELVPLYREYATSTNWAVENKYCAQEEAFAYVQQMAQKMGGTVQEAFQLMDAANLYDITYSPNKYNSSFEVYLDSYAQPFIFICPQKTSYDKLTFAHEFGHFCNDYASYGSYAGVDVGEVFSLGLEYLSIRYVSDGQDLAWLKMADGLSLFVEQAAFAAFEQQMYQLRDDELSVEALQELYDRIAMEYGFDAVRYDQREFVTIPHYYTNPMYIISYVVSNDAALQLYQMELDEAGKGLACFEENLDTQSTYFMEFLEEAGLESPFAEGRVAQIRKTLEAALK